MHEFLCASNKLVAASQKVIDSFVIFWGTSMSTRPSLAKFGRQLRRWRNFMSSIALRRHISPLHSRCHCFTLSIQDRNRFNSRLRFRGAECAQRGLTPWPILTQWFPGCPPKPDVASSSRKYVFISAMSPGSSSRASEATLQQRSISRSFPRQ